MANKSYTIMIVPERSSQVRRLHVPRKTLIKIFIGVSAVVGLAGFLFVNYFYIATQAHENTSLKDENVILKARLRLIQEEMARIDNTLQQVHQFSSKLRKVVQLNDKRFELPKGPLQEGANNIPQVLFAQGERIDYEDELIDSKLALRLADSKLEAIEGDSLRQEHSLRDLYDFFADEREMLLSTIPSIRPTASKLLTSTFGPRVDPYTRQRVMHKGIDFAADHGAEVFAPGDGVVIFSGNRGSHGEGYGNTVVIDHGYGIQTHFAHLSAHKVNVGQKVVRGQAIGSVGNSGRSTGPHLHYEVRVLGVPEDPENFILE